MKKRKFAACKAFVSEHQLLLLFLALLLVGVLCGSYLYGETATATPIRPIKSTVWSVAYAFGQSMLLPLVLLVLLYLAGLTAFGVPVTLVAPFYFGLGIGMTMGYYYTRGIVGVGLCCLFVLPRGLIVSAGLLMAAAESWRMSLRFGRQLMPGGAMGNMWLPFRMYCLRFLLFLAIVSVAGVLDVALRAWCAHWL